MTGAAAQRIGPMAVEPSALNYAMLKPSDLQNIVLQRSDVISDEPRPNDIIRDWMAGQPARLQQAVASRGVIFAQRAARMIQREFEALTPVLDQLRPTKIADIGCGYAVFDLFAYARYGADIFLVDIEQNDHRHFGFEEEASAYTSLASAKAFLVGNGVPELRVTTWNPETQDPPETEEKPDLAVSFLACGFHFPVDMYMPFFRFGVAPGGAVILDLRSTNYQENKRELSKLGRVEELARIKNRRRVVVWKGRT